MTERLSSAAARHPGRTILAWVLAVVASIVLIVFFLGDALSGEGEQLNDPESEQAYDLIGERVPPTDEFTTDVVLIRSPSLEPASPEFARKVDEVTADLRSTPGVVYVTQKNENTTACPPPP